MTTLLASLGGYTLQARVCGPVGAPLAVLVHGMMEAGSVWEPLLPRHGRHASVRRAGPALERVAVWPLGPGAATRAVAIRCA